MSATTTAYLLLAVLVGGVAIGHWLPLRVEGFGPLRDWARDNIGWLVVLGLVIGSVFWPIGK